MIAEEEPPLAREQDAELREPGGTPEAGGILLVPVSVAATGRLERYPRQAGLSGGFVHGAGDGGLGIDEAGVVIGAMLAP